MTRRFASTVALCALLAGSAGARPSAATQENPPIRLLPTDPEAARVRALQNAFDNSPPDDARARDYAELNPIVRDFVVRQLDAAPAIADEVLREQLRKVVGRFWARDDLIALKYAHPQEGAASRAAAWTYEVYAVRGNWGVETPAVTLVSRQTTGR
jgi:hypothetical protein